MFIALEGGEGAGKSSVQQALGDRLGAGGREAVLTREPGGTPLGEQIRALVLAQTSLDDPLTELLLFEVARAHLVASVIRPALARGAVVVCDRFCASSVAYQGYGRGLDPALVAQANEIATGGLTPDLTLLLDLPVETGIARRAGAGDANHFDRADVAFHERVRAGFRALAAADTAVWRVIDAAVPLDDVIDACWREVVAALP